TTLVAAATDDERAALLSAQPELVTPELPLALGRRSDEFRDKKEYGPAITAAQLALKVAEQLNDRRGQGLGWELIGRVYGAQREYRQGLEHYQKALPFFEEVGDKQEASSVLGRIGASYFYLEKYEEAIATNFKRLKLKEELNDKKSIVSTLDDIANAYSNLG